MFRFFLLTLAALLVLAACGGSDSDDGGDDGAEGEPGQTATETDGGNGGEEPDEGDGNGEDDASGPVAFADYLSEGDCYNDVLDDEGEYDYSGEPLIVDCEEPHDNEVVFVTEYPAGPDEGYPGFDALDEFAEETCSPVVDEFLGVSWDDTALGRFYLTAFNDEEWDAGSRSFVCVLYLPDGQLRGSLQGAGAAVFPADFPEDAPRIDGLTLRFINRETDNEPGDDDWGIDPEGMVLARYNHDLPTADAKEMFLAEVTAAGWTIERQDDFATLGLETEFFDLRKDGRQLVVEVWELEEDTTSFEYFWRP